MEVLPMPQCPITIPDGADITSPLPRLVASQQRSFESLTSPRRRCRTRILPKADRNWLSVTTSDDELCAARKPVASTFLTLSPIIASPVCSPTSNFSVDQPAAVTDYVTAPDSPPIGSATQTSTVHAFVLEESHLPSLHLSTSASLPFMTLSHGAQDIIGAQEKGAPVQTMNEKLRSFSDSSLASPRVVNCNFEKFGSPVGCPVEIATVPQPRRHKFHVPYDTKVDDDENVLSVDNAGDTNVKDRIRRFHAVKELLTTELNYLKDLRALVTVFLHNLSIAPSSPLKAGIPIGLYTSYRHGESSDTHDTNAHGKGRPKQMQPRVFSEDKIAVLLRSATAVLQFHEGFIQELEAITKPFGITVGPDGGDDPPNSINIADLEKAIMAIAQKFTREASFSHIYQDFCAAYLEALEVVRRKQHQSPVEWEAFERHCTLIITSSGGSSGELCRTSSLERRKRTASLTALDGAFRSLRAFASREYVPPSFNIRNGTYLSRLTFMDYVIKPVQRICKYPLLLAQLQSRSSALEIGSTVDAMVRESVKAMKDIVATVDEAYHQKDMQIKSSLIASRILLSTASGCVPHLSKVFLSSLGTCLLAGSLDMIHYSLAKSKNGPSNVKVKYVGAFLYAGGYLILVRVNGKVYEPKHWFCLANFDVRDVAEDIAVLSSSFCLFSDDHLVELAAACRKEKDIWLSTIRESLSRSSVWVHEPISSLGSPKRELCLEDFELGPLAKPAAQPCLPDRGPSSSVPDFTTTSLKPDYTLTPARRASSSVSLKAIFIQGGDPDTVAVRRASMTSRQQTDDGLQDVLSRASLDARAYALFREELFQMPRMTQPFVRSNSSVSLKGLTRNRLSRHETVRISRHNSFSSTVARREIIESKSVIVHARDRNTSCASNGALDCGKGIPQSFLPDIQVHSPKPMAITNDVAENPSPSRGLLGVKRFFQSRSTSDVDLAVLHSGNQPSLQRAKTTGNIFRRLSVTAPFHRSAPGNLNDVKRVADAMPLPAHSSGGAPKLLSTDDSPRRRRAISRPTSRTERMSILQYFRN